MSEPPYAKSMFNTHIPTSSRLAVKERSLGRCERCGGPGAQWHHRRSRSVVEQHRHCPCNGIWMCPTCHAWAHRHPTLAQDEGLIVPRYVTSPRDWGRGFVHYQGRRVRPECDGTLSTVETEEE